jgi:RimJ/RimL family protein N-acetyltransferase
VRGARRIGLSTQGDNARSQRMYEHVGFKRSRSNDYRLYGHWLRDPEPAP